MARKIEFDKHKALGIAMECFWKNGYEATSLRDVAAAMNLNLGSLYNSFGNKDQLFEMLLDHYAETVVSGCLDQLRNASDPLQGLRAFFLKVEQECADSDSARGCFLLNTAIELSSSNPALAAVAKNYMQVLEDLFAALLTKALENGSIVLHKNHTPASLAHYLIGVLLTLRTLSRMKTDPALISNYLKTALYFLD
jgi:TetR/AcrR family transcriptional repressor of nem operon